MRRIGLTLIIAKMLATLVTAPGNAQPSLTVSTPTAPAGSSVEVAWRAPESSHVFLSGYGAVPSTGVRRLTALRSMTYYLVVESPAGIAILSRALDVTGGRGYEPVDRALFSYPQHDRITIQSFTALCDRIEGILQNELGFSVSHYQAPGEEFVFVAGPSVQPDLVGKDEPDIRERRLSFLVELSLPGSLPAEVQLTISTQILYRRWIERTWRPDDSEALHRNEARRLRARILSSLKAAKPS